MLSHRGFSAYIVSGDHQLPEYLVAVDENAHRVTCWIQGEAGETFTVCWVDNGTKFDTCAFITLDGYVVPGRFLFGSGMTYRKGVRSGNATERPFVFAKVEETTKENVSNAATKGLGTICLRIKRVERTASRAPNPVQTIPDPVVGNRQPGDLYIGFGPETQTYNQYPATWAVKPHREDKSEATRPSTYVTFVFRYRSQEFLETQGILNEVPVIPKGGMRRVVSAPPQSFPMTPCPSPKTKASLVGQSLSKGKRKATPEDDRRVVSMRALIGGKYLPGEGVMRFDSHFMMKYTANGQVKDEVAAKESG